LVDLNGDKKTDMVSGSWPGEIYIFDRKPNGSFAPPRMAKTVDGKNLKVGSASAVAAADWDGDGHGDLIIGNIEGAIFWVKNTGKGVFAKPEPLKAGGSAIALGNDSGPCLADWDGDGLLDLLVGTGYGDVQFYKNIGSTTQPKLDKARELVSKTTRSPSGDSADRSGIRAKPAVADWNGDGLVDLLVGDFVSQPPSGTHGYVWVYLREKKTDVSRAAK
jgi:hypothetical protein